MRRLALILVVSVSCFAAQPASAKSDVYVSLMGEPFRTNEAGEAPFDQWVGHTSHAAAQFENARACGRGGGDHLRLVPHRQSCVHLDRAAVRGDRPWPRPLKSLTRLDAHIRSTAARARAVPLTPHPMG